MQVLQPPQQSTVYVYRMVKVRVYFHKILKLLWNVKSQGLWQLSLLFVHVYVIMLVL